MTENDVAIAAFIKRNVSEAKDWPRDRLLGLVRWHVSNGLAAIGTANGKVKAVGLARVLKQPKQWHNRFYHNEKGKFVYVDMAHSKHPSGFRFLLDSLIKAFPEKKSVVWNRPAKDSKTRIFNMETIKKRFSYGQ